MKNKKNDKQQNNNPVAERTLDDSLPQPVVDAASQNGESVNLDNQQSKDNDVRKGEQELSLLEKIGSKWAKRKIDELKAELNEKNSSLSDIERRLVESSHQCNLLEKGIKDRDETISSLQKDVKKSETELNSVHSDKLKLEKEKSEVLEQVKNLQKSLEDEKEGADVRVRSASNDAAQREAQEILRKFRFKFKGLTADTIDLAMNNLADTIRRLNDEKNEAVANVLRANEGRSAAESQVEKIKNDAETLVKKIQEEANLHVLETQRMADARVAEIEATDNGQLVVQLELAKKELSEKVESLNEKVINIQNLNTQLDESKQNIAAFKAELKEREDLVNKYCDEKEVLSRQHSLEIEQLRSESAIEITNLKQIHIQELEASELCRKRDLENLKLSYKNDIKEREREYCDKLQEVEFRHCNEVKRLEDKNESDLASQKSSYEQLLSDTKSDNQRKLQAAKNEHDTYVASIKEIARREKEQLEAKINEHIASISGLEKTMTSESSAFRSSVLEMASSIYSFLSKYNIMAACDDVFEEKVDEKLQDLRFDSKRMLSDLESLPIKQTSSQWKNELQHYLMKQLPDTSSLINRLLKYRTLSDVPFMIDEKRDNGLYFIRDNIKRVSEYIYVLLAQCGIVPVLPALFVENANDDQYEVNGQFNDIESFCPGSINEHISHIERSESGLEKLIVGVTRVGYVVNGEYRIKAQIIIR